MEAETPSREVQDEILYFMTRLYDQVRTDVTEYNHYDTFMKCVRSLDNSSSPGYPFMREKPTIGEWLGFNGVEYDSVQLSRLWLMVLERINTVDFDCLWRVFIKQEPHKTTKAETKRWRLIMCPPLDIQLVWQMLFSEMNSKEIDLAFSLPSQQGIVLVGGEWKRFKKQWENEGTTCGADKTAWDWTVPGWMLDLDLRLRVELTYGAGQTQRKWTTIALGLYRNAFENTRLLLSDGSVYRQLNAGIMKSGCVNTISSNSHCQVMLHLLYSVEKGISPYPMVKACGDDTLQHEKHVDDISVYEKYGFKIKSVSSTIEFVGHEFASAGPRPMYLGKHMFNLAHCDDETLPEVLDGYLGLYTNYDMIYEMLRRIAYKVGLGHRTRSRNYHAYWYHNPMSREKWKGHYVGHGGR